MQEHGSLGGERKFDRDDTLKNELYPLIVVSHFDNNDKDFLLLHLKFFLIMWILWEAKHCPIPISDRIRRRTEIDSVSRSLYQNFFFRLCFFTEKSFSHHKFFLPLPTSFLFGFKLLNATGAQRKTFLIRRSRCRNKCQRHYFIMIADWLCV